MALGGRVGVGNIAGVATAIFYGGPGALFWMWVYALLGAASAFAESTAGQIWKTEDNGEYCSGPAQYIAAVCAANRSPFYTLSPQWWPLA